MEGEAGAGPEVSENPQDLVPVASQWVSQEPAAIPEKAADRRTWPGAATSDEDFAAFFESCTAACAGLQEVTRSAPNVGHSIMNSAARAIHNATAAFPDASYHFVRMVAVCLVASVLRFPDYTLREHVLIVWILEGEHRIRSHDGFCYIYHDDGAFQEYKRGVIARINTGAS